jgi:uncharacterized protein YdeI (YjbR/CyaY-like superfamily)
MMNPEVNVYFDQLKQWKPELTVLRKLLLESELKEEFKWSTPCYTDQGKNIVLLGITKAYCTLSFVKVALLTDPENLLQKVGPNSRSVTYIPFQSVEEIYKIEVSLKKYIQEAFTNERKGLKVAHSKEEQWEIPLELLEKFNSHPELKLLFLSLQKEDNAGIFCIFPVPNNRRHVQLG